MQLLNSFPKITSLWPYKFHREHCLHRSGVLRNHKVSMAGLSVEKGHFPRKWPKQQASMAFLNETDYTEQAAGLETFEPNIDLALAGQLCGAWKDHPVAGVLSRAR